MIIFNQLDKKKKANLSEIKAIGILLLYVLTCYNSDF